jgi:hypothetical protein
MYKLFSLLICVALINTSMRLHEIAGAVFPVPFLYHVTPKKNLASIQKAGLQVRYYGEIHGEMDIHPPVPCIYLSRKPRSDNLNTNITNHGDLVVLKIDASKLNEINIWPDDFVYEMFSNEEILATAGSVAKALSISKPEAKAIFDQLQNAKDSDLPALLKPFWKWYLMLRKGGEIAYSANIPPAAILAVSDY